MVTKILSLKLKTGYLPSLLFVLSVKFGTVASAMITDITDNFHFTFASTYDVEFCKIS